MKNCVHYSQGRNTAITVGRTQQLKRRQTCRKCKKSNTWLIIISSFCSLCFADPYSRPKVRFYLKYKINKQSSQWLSPKETKSQLATNSSSTLADQLTMESWTLPASANTCKSASRLTTKPVNWAKLLKFKRKVSNDILRE